MRARISELTPATPGRRLMVGMILVAAFAGWGCTGTGSSDTAGVDGTVTLATGLQPTSAAVSMVVAIYAAADFATSDNRPKTGAAPVYSTVISDLRNPPYTFTLPAAERTGLFYVVAWVDQDGSGVSSPGEGDLYGVYGGNPIPLSRRRLTGVTIELREKLGKRGG